MKLTLDKIAAIMGAECTSQRLITTLITDSRSLCDVGAGLFFALKTASNDGHKYIVDLYRQGVRAFVVETVPEIFAMQDDVDFIVVDSPLDGLRRLATHIRDHFAGTLVAISGSRGKTIVKEMTYTALIKAGRNVVRSPRSWNSQIGVPLSLWQIEEDTEIAIIEAGIDHPGQMAVHSAMLRPDIAVLTHISDEHDGGFESHQQKIDEKLLLLDNCPVTIEGDNNRQLASRLLQTLGCDPDWLDGVSEVSTRLDVHDGVNDCMMIYDEFTADFTSLSGALDFMRRRYTASRRNTLILGDLIHRPDEDVKALYNRVARLVNLAGIDRLIGVGHEVSEHSTCFDPLTASEFLKSTDEFLDRYDISDFTGELILVKGQKSQSFDAIRRHLEAPRHHSILEVNLDAVVDNFNAYRQLLNPGTGIVAMVKASGYGTGALELAKTLQSQGASYLAVAVVEEGVALRRAGITMPIMVLNPVTTNYQALFGYRLEPAVFSIYELDMLIAQAARYGQKNYPVHIKFDTGMHRLGFIDSELDSLLDVLGKSDEVKVVSAFSHLSSADCLDQDSYTDLQFDIFERLTSRLMSGLDYQIKRHILNTAGIMRYPQRQYDMVRLGIGLYGISPLPQNETKIKLRPVSKLSSTVISLKLWPEETTVGYGRRGRLTRESIIATVPIGYADGIDRSFGCGRAFFVVNGHKCPTVGNICMDICMIDVTGADAHIGDRVEIFGPEAPVERLAEVRGTIPYEILTSVSNRIHRIYYRE